jgi:hypothetical protein
MKKNTEFVERRRRWGREREGGFDFEIVIYRGWDLDWGSRVSRSENKEGLSNGSD